MSKRRRVSAGRVRGGARPIDKQLTFINLNDIDATTSSTLLFVAAAPCTLLGIRWSLTIEGDAGTVGNPHDFRWIIVKLDDGDNINALNAANQADFYTPEQDVMAFGFGSSRTSSTASTGMNSPTIEGATKTMRKLRIGDGVHFAIRGAATDTVRAIGIIQSFCKS